MDIERFHNELAMRLGYERIVKDKRIMISVEESEEPFVTLKVDGYDDIRLKASEKPKNQGADMNPEMREVIIEIADTVHQAYIVASATKF